MRKGLLVSQGRFGIGRTPRSTQVRYHRYKHKAGGYWRGRSRFGRFYTRSGGCCLVLFAVFILTLVATLGWAVSAVFINIDGGRQSHLSSEAHPHTFSALPVGARERKDKL